MPEKALEALKAAYRDHVAWMHAQAQSIASGLPQFAAGGGVQRADLKFGAIWDFSDHWSARLSGGEGILLGDAADSPITREKAAPSASLGVAYRF